MVAGFNRAKPLKIKHAWGQSNAFDRWRLSVASLAARVWLTMHRPLEALVIIVMSIGVCAAAHAQTTTEPILDRMAAEFQEAYNRGDTLKVASFYAEDAVVMPPNRPMVQGRAAIAAILRANLADDPATMRLIPIESAIAGTRAYEVGRRVMTWQHGLVLNEKYTRVFKRVGDEWKIAYWIWNGDSPATPPR